MNSRLFLSVVALIAATLVCSTADAQRTSHKPKSLREISDPVEQLKEVDTNWPECREYIPEKGPCKVIVNLSRSEDQRHLAYAPWDVTVQPGGEAVVLLQHGSPFVSCTLTAAAAPLSRDSSSSFSTFLTAVAGLGAVGAKPIAPAAKRQAPDLRQATEALKGKSDYDAALHIYEQLKTLRANIDLLRASLQQQLSDIQNTQSTIQDALAYSYKDEDDFKANAKKLWNAVDAYQQEPLPNVTSAEVELDSIKTALKKFHASFDDPADQLTENWTMAADAETDAAAGDIKLFQDRATDISNARTQFKQLYTLLLSISKSGSFNQPFYTKLVLPMTGFAQKQVTETITCKDAITQAPAFDNVAFTAYYERFPMWDFSVGAVVSLLGGRQVGPVTGALPSGGGTPPTVLAVTSSSRVQWIPTTFMEFHPYNFQCPWAKNGDPNHRFGYACSLGVALGLAINPNNGGTTPEYVEGFSFGIHRVAIFVGNHTGTVQDFLEGFSVGETVPSGTTPLTHRRWTNHPAFGITYRIPLR